MDDAALKAAGFSDREIQLSKAGFSDDEIKAATAPAPTAKPATFGSTLARAAYNTPMDLADTLKAGMQQFGPEGVVAQTVMHPIKAAEGVGDFAHKAADVLTGGLQHVRDMSSPDAQGDAPRMDTTSYDQFHDKYLTKQGIYKQIGDHPVGTLLSAASILDPALRAGGVEGGLPTVASRVGDATGVLADGAKDAIAARLPPKPAPVPSTVDLKTSASALYKKAKDAGVVIDGQSFANFSDDAKAAMGDEGIDPDLHPKANAALNRIANTGGDVSLNKLEILRKIAGDAAGATDKADRRLGRMLQDHIDDYAENLQPHNIIAGDAPKAVALLNQARSTWQAAARGQTIDDLIAKAKQNAGTFNSNLDTAYRTAFKKLANNDRGMARFTQEQQDAIRKVGFGDGPIQGILHTIGRVIPSSNAGVLTTSGVAAGAHLLGAPVSGPVGATVAAAGLGGKIGSTLITSKNAARASEMARTNSKITPRSDAYYQIQQRRAARANAMKGP